MDSMRSLNSSLPKSGGRRRTPRSQNNAELLQAFRTAALSVTQLYKSAVADYQNAREAGYQEALGDILGFLDKENIGLDDGEGWRVRQWATERLSPESFGIDGDTNDTDEEDLNNKDPRMPSPANATPTQAAGSPTTVVATADQPSSSDVGAQHPNASDSGTTQDVQPATAGNPSSIFTFQSSGPAIDFAAMDAEDTAAVNPTTNRLQRHTGGSSKRYIPLSAKDQVNAISLGFLGSGAGGKRKATFTDFFDVEDLSTRNYGGSSKRGRHS